MAENKLNPVRIAVDAHRLICEPLTSGATYLGALLTEWLQYPDGPRMDLLLPRQPTSPESGEQPLFTHPKVRLLSPVQPVDPIASYRAQFFWQQRSIPALLSRERPDIYFSPFHLTPQRPLGLPVVTTIHDLCWLQEPRWSLGAFIHWAQLWSACLRARRLICVSQFTFEMLAGWSPRFARKAQVVHNGIQGRTLPLAEAQQQLGRLQSDLAPEEYLFWIGNPTPRKNPRLLFAAFNLYHQRFPTHKLAIVAPESAHAQLRALAQAQGVEPALRLFARMDNVMRDVLYRCARALLFPSSCEGFGYPILEAMYQGCAPFCFREGPGREMVEGILPMPPELTPEAFDTALSSYLALAAAERDHVRARLISRANDFSAKAMACGTLAVLRRTCVA